MSKAWANLGLKVTEQSRVATPPHQPGLLPPFLRQQGADCDGTAIPWLPGRGWQDSGWRKALRAVAIPPIPC